MCDPQMFDHFPENTVIVSGDSLLSLRHMPVPPNLDVVIRNPQNENLVYEILREEYPDVHQIQLIDANGSHNLELEDLKIQGSSFENAAYLFIPALPENHAFETFQNTVAVLRGPHGCPWDKRQTHQSIRDNFLQEAYELLDGLDRNDKDVIVEELGDLLFHVILQTQMGIDNGEFNMGDVISHINEKIIYRHPHVFGNPEGIDADQVSLLWEQIKQKEREKQHKKGGLLDGISRSMPALSMAYSYQSRAAKAGFEWKNESELREKLLEELDEFQNAQTQEEKEEELGDILFSVVNFARFHKVDPETALRMTNVKFYDRVHYIEAQALNQHSDLFNMPREEKEKYWNEYKAKQRSAE